VIATGSTRAMEPDNGATRNTGSSDRLFLMIVQENTTGWDLFQTVSGSID
jgi:hypothetical protein